ncbi:MAG: excinuclease ABC subunit UvrC, partial [Gammaproteobacteria bacterium]
MSGEARDGGRGAGPAEAGRGAGAALRELVRRAPDGPGVYRLLDSEGQVLYVGKAVSLRRRLASYLRPGALGPRQQALMARVRDIAWTVTRNEAEALILEHDLIKAHRPRYNVLLRDDKSYPSIAVTVADPFPRLAFHRGPRREGVRYFGPYPSAGAVRETLGLLQKLFQVRSCEDGFFRNRTRPCLQHQIQRCSAPCVGLVEPERYREDVRHAMLFLEGRSQEVVEALVGRMEQASAALAFEQAARYRDQIAALRRVQAGHLVAAGAADADVLAAATAAGQGCVALFVVRGGRVLGARSFFPRQAEGPEPGELLAAFLGQHYLAHEPPPEIVLSHPVEEAELLERALSERSGRRVRLRPRPRGERARWLELALANARQALEARLAGGRGVERRLRALQEALGLEGPLERLECFDISHSQGEAPVASCVVLDRSGLVKAEYRRFNIRGVAPGDDYAAMEQALRRRFTRLVRGEGKLPDLLLIDGGKGQVARARQVLEELQVRGLPVLGVAKGPGRRPGLERLFLSARGAPLILPQGSPALHLVQQLRDEAHRFAVAGHRRRREGRRRRSPLEGIPGLGPKRRRLLLTHCGGLQEVARAGVEELARIPGISRALAQRIYEALHGEALHGTLQETLEGGLPGGEGGE